MMGHHERPKPRVGGAAQELPARRNKKMMRTRTEFRNFRTSLSFFVRTDGDGP